MNSYFTTLHPYWFQLRNHFRMSADLRQTYKRDVLLFAVTVLLLACIYAGVAMILGSVDDDLLFRELIPTKLLELLCYAFLILQTVGATIAFTGNIYHSESMNLHLSTPLSSTRLFLSKFIETLFETSFMFAVFTFPIGLAYVRVLELPVHFLFVACAALVPFLIIPNALGFIIASVLTYCTALFWKRGSIVLLAIAGVSLWVLQQLFSLLAEVQLQRGGGNAIVHLIGLFDNPNPTWLPSYWLAAILNSFIQQGDASLAINVALLCSTAIGSLAAAFLVYDFCMLNIRSRCFSHDGGTMSGAREAKRDSMRRCIEGVYERLPVRQELRAVMIKDMTSLFRDRSQSLKILMYLGIALSYLILIKFMSSALILNVFGLSAWYAVLGGINVLFAGFIITALMTRLVYPSISLEGRAFWIMNSAPIALGDLLKAKFYCWLPLMGTISVTLVLAGVFIIHPSVSTILASIVLGSFLAIGCTGMAVGIGAVFARFEWESANQIATGLGTLVLFFCSLVFVALLALSSVGIYLALIPPWDWYLHGYYLALLLLGCFSVTALCTSLFARISQEKGAKALALKRR